ncbi:MAG: endonuclease, partial [Gammaproteobacteria bacterium]
MKLSASNIAWHAEDDVTVYQRLKALGFSGVEIAPTRWVQDAPYSAPGIATASSIARALNSDWGLSVSSMQS